MSENKQFTTLDEYGDYLDMIADTNPKVGNASAKLLRSDKNIDSVMADRSLSEREFIEIIASCRKVNYNKAIGGANKAAENETDRLYAKNPWKFVEEFLQNADDCDYAETPEISITIDEGDEQHCSIEFCYNEEGFTRSDIWAITAFSESTKVNDIVKRQEETGVFYKEKTGRKGKGFKSVFSLSAENIIVHIRSNGFSFKLDNRIGRIMPVWEDDPARMDKNTYVIVELIKPEFSVSEIYPEFRRLFCVDNYEGIFTYSPFLFMHRLRMVHVTRISEISEETFITEYKEKSEKTVYAKPFDLDKEKNLLAGIAKDGVYYYEQFQEGEITTLSGDDNYFSIPLIRYTRMVEDKESYRNYSIIAPIITADTDITWQRGALFRTFPMSMHPIEMPLAIDAPFILNPDRSGVQYSTYKDEEGQQVSANIWNAEVSERLFEQNGVYENFFLWLRSIEGVRVDRYMTQAPIVLFRDENNSDGHGKTWIPQVDISSLCHGYPVFHLFAKPDGFVCFNDARIVNKSLFSWPHIKDFFRFMLGENYENCILSDTYVGSSLFRARPIVEEGFTKALNSYLDVVEEALSLDSDEMFTFFNTQLYPFLRDNASLIIKTESDAFKKMCIYLSRVKQRDSIEVVRESFPDHVKWFHSDSGESLLSINRYRVYESSPVDINILGKITEGLFEKRTLYLYFSGKNQAIAAKNCRTWDDAKDYIEAVLHFGYDIGTFRFECLKNYVLSEKFDRSFNAFRETGVLRIIDDVDIHDLSYYFDNSINNTVKALIRMGVRTGRDFFVSEGSYLALSPDTVKMLESELCPTRVFEEIRSVQKESGRYINTTYDIIRYFREDALLFFLDESKGLFSTDLYADICDRAQEDRRFWSRDDKVSNEILIRAVAGASTVLKNKEARSRSISIEDVLNSRLEDCIIKIRNNNAIGRLVISNNGFFERIPDEEIRPRLSLLKYDDGTMQTAYYKGDMSYFGGRKRYLRDIQGGNVYLKCDANGDYYASLEKLSEARFDLDALKYVGEMERQYKDVKEHIIVPIFNKVGHNLKRAYNDIERRFKEYDKRQIISILSWFRSQGYTNALGNGNINNEKEIEDDYRDDPWKFIYEFIQNVDDCSYSKEGVPELDITISEADGQIIFEYNEDGFTLDDVKALTKFGDSNKKESLDEMYVEEGLFDLEKTGRKGRGFKSVFALPGDGIIVHILSNGFYFKFVKKLGTIIPIWEDTCDVPETGTRIVVEGFQKGYIAKLIPEIRKIFGVNDITEFFAVCPILFLRKIRKVSVSSDKDILAVDIRVKNRQFTKGVIEAPEKPVAGILHQGDFRRAMWETDEVKICISGEVRSFSAVRNCFAFEVGNKQRIASFFAPIITDRSDIAFRKGALYSTLPLDGHVIPIPVSINAPFETDSGRSIVADNSQVNRRIARVVFESILQSFYKQLRTVSDISIERYIPSGSAVLFEGYKYIDKVDMAARIKDYQILKSFDGERFVSCREGIVLPKECYTWINPTTLSSCFDEEGLTLIARRYSALPGVSRVYLNSIRFVEYLNTYLDMLSVDDEAYIRLMYENIYPYISANFETIRKTYRAEGKPDALKGMRIFIFRMFDGSYIRESAEENDIWMKDVPKGYLSFGKYRSIDTSALSGRLDECKWVEELHRIIGFDAGFTKEMLEETGIRDWAQTEELLGTMLYYNVKRNPRIPYLAKCVLSEEYDQEENLFREGYLATGAEGILDRVIDRNDLMRICESAKVKETGVFREFADSIKAMGLKRADDFFDSRGRGIYSLNTAALALLEEFCKDRDTAGRVLLAVDSAFNDLKKKNPSATLHVTYDDLRDCSPIVFSRIFEYEMSGTDIRGILAGDYCDSFSGQTDMDSAEAYIRALDVVGTVKESRNIILSLSQIRERCLGRSLQNCKVANPDKLKLTIVADEDTNDYPSNEIDRALKWLDDENAVSVSYEYYTADLREAFGDTEDEATFFLFDDSKVFLDKSDAENCMLRFVQKRYRGKDASFSALIHIITEQNELKKEWKQSKKEYIEKLARFRKDTLAKQEVLFPNYDIHLNEANGKAVDYVIPELLQNINDCKAGQGQDERTLEVEIDSDAGTMLLRYDEAGFNYSNVYSITAIGQSSKHDESEGEKGLGFKKVFSLFEKVEIYSNGFCFVLNSKEKTVPKWIGSKEKQDKYLTEGKTTMLFSVTGSNKKRLPGIYRQWKALIDGEYVGSKISPLFLKNIDFIRLNDMEKCYSRKAMEQEFIYMKVPLLSFYGRILSECGVRDAVFYIDGIKKDLKTRRKCRLMSPDEQEEYVDSLSIEICIPKRINDSNRGKGCFYSTLPTEEPLFASVFINVPLELTTGRDGIVEESEYNKTVFRTLFTTDEECPSVFNRLFEVIADSNRGIFLLNYIMPDAKSFIETISVLTGEEEKAVCERFERLRILRGYGVEGPVSIAESYSVDRIIYQYLKDVQNSINDIELWMKTQIPEKVSNLKLLDLLTVDECDKVENYARLVNSPSCYFPIEVDDRDLMIEYLSDEYGHEGR